MTLFREEDRHPKDSRVLIIKNMADFALWRERAELRISGIICAYPIDPETLEIAAIQLSNSSQKPENSWIKPYDCFNEGAQNLECRKTYSIAKNIENFKFFELMANDNINETAQNIISHLTDIYNDITDQKGKATDIEININTTRTQGYHCDDNAQTLTFAFSQGGTICNTGEYISNFKASGDDYELANGVIMIMDGTITHKSQAYDYEWEWEPRVSIVI